MKDIGIFNKKDNIDYMAKAFCLKKEELEKAQNKIALIQIRDDLDGDQKVNKILDELVSSDRGVGKCMMYLLATAEVANFEMFKKAIFSTTSDTGDCL